MKFHTNSIDQNDATRSTAMASFHDARDTKMSTKQTDYMKLRIIFTEVYYDDQVIDGEPEWHYSPREYTAHIQIVRDEEKRLQYEHGNILITSQTRPNSSWIHFYSRH